MIRTKNLAVAFSAVLSLGIASSTLVACGGGDAKAANVTPGNMPDGESWQGVYYHPVFGYLHMVEQGTSVVGKWKRTDQSAWGELSGTETGNVVHFTWKEHKYNQVGPSSTSSGKGYFVYKINSDKTAELDGQYGLGDDETGSEWHNVKQLHMNPDLNSITGGGDDPQTSSEHLQ
ncbi:MAG: hypothetical protein ABI461_00820 [Polyangiaceae bacterium]